MVTVVLIFINRKLGKPGGVYRYVCGSPGSDCFIPCTDMKAGLCGFCRRGREVSGTCGKLHEVTTAEDTHVVAHKRCMQYSANLRQYSSHRFGGFRIQKVLKEYRRGCSLRCRLCGDLNKSKNSKENIKARGATAGCAVESCAYTFHYYCVKKDKSAIAKKLKRPHGEEEYRIFCSSEHEVQYRKEKIDLESCEESSDSEGGEEEFNDNGDESNEDSDVSGREDVDDDAETGSGDNEWSLPTALPSSSSSSDDGNDVGSDDTDDNLSLKKTRYVTSKSNSSRNRRSKRRKPDNLSDTSEESSSEPEDDRLRTTRYTNSSNKERTRPKFKSGTRLPTTKHDSSQSFDDEEPRSNTRMSTKRRLNFSGTKRTSDTIQNDDIVPLRKGRGMDEGSEDDIQPVQKKRRRDSTVDRANSVNPGNSVSKTSPQKSPSSGRKNTKQRLNKSRHLPACALCLTEHPQCNSRNVRCLKETITKKYGILPQNIFLWQDLDLSTVIPERNRLAFIKDLANHVFNDDADEVGKLLLDSEYLKQTDNEKYQKQADVLQDLGETISEHIWATIKTTSATNKRVEVIKESQGKHCLVLLLDDTGVDSDGELRKKLGVTEESLMVKWTSDTAVKSIENGNRGISHLERDTILDWIHLNIPIISHVYVHPQEELLLPVSKGTVADLVATHLQEVQTEGKQIASVLVFRQVDEEVVNFLPYCRKAIRKVLPSCVRTGCELTVVLDIQSLKAGDIHQQIQSIFQDDKGKLSVTVRSAFDPSCFPVCCVVVDIHIGQLSDFTLLQKDTSDKKLHLNDDQSPSTSG